MTSLVSELLTKIKLGLKNSHFMNLIISQCLKSEGLYSCVCAFWKTELYSVVKFGLWIQIIYGQILALILPLYGAGEFTQEKCTSVSSS